MLEIASILLVIATVFGVLNHHFLKLPQTIGILIVTLVAAGLIYVVDFILPHSDIREFVAKTVASFDFSEAVLEGMLGILLFAGALHVKVTDLRKSALPILLMASVGVVISAALIGGAMTLIFGMPILMALIFGTIISPTDPVAVLGVLKEANLSQKLQTKIAGESLFNDGVAYVLYLVLVAIAFPALNKSGHDMDAVGVITLFAQEVFGGVIIGALLGFLAYAIMRTMDDYVLEVMTTVALAFSGYVLSRHLHVSAPIMAVVAGLIIGYVGYNGKMSETTRRYLNGFWEMLDEILNAVLFVMIGFEIFILTVTTDYVLAGIFAVILGLVARSIAVAIPLFVSNHKEFSRSTVKIMTWAGVKGGVSIALALALPANEWKALILTATYIVVVVSMIGQGLSLKRVANWALRKEV